MNILAITQARSGSTRLPMKIFMAVGNKTLLQIHLERLKRSKRITRIIVATTTNVEDQRVCDVAVSQNLAFYRGSENDVLDRFYQAAKNDSPDFVVRITSDCPLIDPVLIDAVIAKAVQENVDYCSNVLKETFPDGQDIEVFTFASLEKAWKEAKLDSEREHVTPFIRKHSDFNGGKIFKAVNVEAEVNFGGIRMTVDEKADFDVIKELIDQLGTEKSWQDYAAFIVNNKTIAGRNAHINRNEGYIKSLKKEQ